MKGEQAPPGDVLRVLAKRRGWSEGDVMRCTGLSRAKVNELLNGRKEKAAPSTIKALMLGFLVPAAELYGRAGEDDERVRADVDIDLAHSLCIALSAEFAGSSLKKNRVDENKNKIISLLDVVVAPLEIRKHLTASDDVLKNAPLASQLPEGGALRKGLKGRPVSVATNTMECGTVAALLLAKHLLEAEDVELQVDYHQIHGGDLVRELNAKRKAPDFAVLGGCPGIPGSDCTAATCLLPAALS
jgi:transcriptional regulator with XRE-family HTH domain